MTPQEVRTARTSHRYRLWRRRLLARESLCRLCHAAGFTVAAEELDHIVPVEAAPDRFWDEGNVQPICRVCHEAKSAGQNRRETLAQVAWRKRLEVME